MAGLFIQQRQSSNAASNAQIVTGSITTSAGDSCAFIVTYTGATTTVSLSTDFGTWVEDVSLRHAAGGGVGMHVFTLDNCNAFTGTITVTFGAARTNRGTYFVEASGLDHYIAGVFPAYQIAPGAANDSITSGNYNVTGAASTPNYLLGMCWDQSNPGITPSVGSAASALFTSEGTGWLFGGTVGNARIMDARRITDGNVAASFTSSAGGTDTFAALLLAFAESISTYTLMSQCMY